MSIETLYGCDRCGRNEPSSDQAQSHIIKKVIINKREVALPSSGSGGDAIVFNGDLCDRCRGTLNASLEKLIEEFSNKPKEPAGRKETETDSDEEEDEDDDEEEDDG